MTDVFFFKIQREKKVAKERRHKENISLFEKLLSAGNYSKFELDFNCSINIMIYIIRISITYIFN